MGDCPRKCLSMGGLCTEFMSEGFLSTGGKGLILTVFPGGERIGPGRFVQGRGADYY